MSYIKPFDQELYNKYNDSTLGLIAEVMELVNKQWKVVVRKGKGKDDKGVDAELYQNGELFGYIEGERKKSWTSRVFDYAHQGIDFLFKKKKYFGKPVPTFFVLVNNECSRLVITHEDNLASLKPFRKKNKYDNGHDEFFLRMPIDGVMNALPEELRAYRAHNDESVSAFAAFIDVPDAVRRKYTT